jgi:hypothetical protein
VRGKDSNELQLKKGAVMKKILILVMGIVIILGAGAISLIDERDSNEDVGLESLETSSLEKNDSTENQSSVNEISKIAKAVKRQHRARQALLEEEESPRLDEFDNASIGMKKREVLTKIQRETENIESRIAIENNLEEREKLERYRELVDRLSDTIRNPSR